MRHPVSTHSLRRCCYSKFSNGKPRLRVAEAIYHIENKISYNLHTTEGSAYWISMLLRVEAQMTFPKPIGLMERAEQIGLTPLQVRGSGEDHLGKATCPCLTRAGTLPTNPRCCKKQSTAQGAASSLRYTGLNSADTAQIRPYKAGCF